MTKSKFNKIYQEVFDDLYPKVKDIKRGLLYKSIQILLMEEECGEQIMTKKICEELDIQPHSYIKEDFPVIIDYIFWHTNKLSILSVDSFKNDILSIAGIYDSYSNSLAKDIHQLNLTLLEFVTVTIKDIILNQALQNYDQNKEEKKMELIVIFATLIVGTSVLIAYRNKSQAPVLVSSKDDKAQISPTIPAALCLVAPASAVSELQLQQGSNCSREALKDLISKISHFLCIPQEKISQYENDLQIIDEPIETESPREVYLRIDFENGSQLIDEKLRFNLTRKLPESQKFTVERLGCLKNLNGLEKFNRI